MDIYLIAIIWLIIGIILGYRREEKNSKRLYGGIKYGVGIIMVGSVLACPIILLYAIVKYVFMRPWD